MPVSMDIKGKGSCHVEVVLNKKNNDLFTEVKSDSNNIDLNQESINKYIDVGLKTRFSL